MPRHAHLTRTAALALAAIALSGCGLDLAASGTSSAPIPAGYHQMPDGTLMANVAPEMGELPETEYRAIGASGIELPTHTMADGTVMLGPAHDPAAHAGGHSHPVPLQADFAAGVVPVLLQIPRLGLAAPVVATTMDAGRIQGPPVAGDVAWLSPTRRPGEPGPAVIGGVTSIGDDAGAFAELELLAPGDELVIVGEDGELLPYVVDEVGFVPVADRAQAVFGFGENRSELRLVAWSVGDAGDDARDYLVRAHALTAPEIS